MYAKAEYGVANTFCDFSTYTQAQEQAESPPEIVTPSESTHFRNIDASIIGEVP